MRRLLAVNTGSSSLKLGVFHAVHQVWRERSIHVARVGDTQSRLTVHDEAGHVLLDERRRIADHADALRCAFDSLDALTDVTGVGHRIVRSARRYQVAEELTPALVEELRPLASLDPDHTPQSLAVIAESQRLFPAARHFACFDSAFHRTMPVVAQLYPLPRRFFDQGILRFGFHGLSCEYIISRLRSLHPAAAEGRLIVAHLGSGASLTAVAAGQSVDTTMGFSPTSGITMSTRSGDLDPTILLHMQDTLHKSTADLRALTNQQSGLLGISGSTSDMRELLEREVWDAAAAEAVALFCYIAKKHLGALMTVLGGIDTLVFTGGIGEHAAPVRRRICAGLESFGIVIDSARNSQGEPIISSEGSRVTVRVMSTDEEMMIAMHVRRQLTEVGNKNVSF